VPRGADEGERPSGRGRLWIVATPLGNVLDISERARRCLAQCDCVLAEDTRRAKRLLDELDIAGKRIERLDAHVERAGVGKWLSRLEGGEDLALISDAGTPAVSDPGAQLVAAAADAGASVIPLPGPSAVTAALAATGFAGSRFRFMGFLPRRGAERTRALERICDSDESVVLFEAPARMSATLREFARLMPDRAVLVAREISKTYEEYLRGTLEHLASSEAERAWKGEITVVLGPWQRPAASIDDEGLNARIDELRHSGLKPKQIAKTLALETGLGASELYQRITARRRIE